jgi:hypothetical protein
MLPYLYRWKLLSDQFYLQGNTIDSHLEGPQFKYDTHTKQQAKNYGFYILISMFLDNRQEDKI